VDYDIFNGDADGICSLIQLRLAEPRESTLVTGVKRDINLLARVEAEPGDRLTVLDVSMEKNLKGLTSALEADAGVLYVDHHFAGDIPEHPNLTVIINEAPDICTAVLVNGHLGGQFTDWAITGAFGDNLRETARRLANSRGLSTDEQLHLEELGVYVNYNGYGPSIADLHFDPEDLYRELLQAGDPMTFVHHSPAFTRLREGYREDMALAQLIQPLQASDAIAIFVLPNHAWARRVSGVYSNNLATSNPARAHAVLTEKDDGNYLVSVRAPLGNKRGAADLCRQFPTGGGREAAAGINDLPVDALDAFSAAMGSAYGDT
jgi:hypothetical protein